MQRGNRILRRTKRFRNRTLPSSPQGANNLIDIFNRVPAYLTFLGEKLRFHITQRGSHTVTRNLRDIFLARRSYLIFSIKPVYTPI